MKCFILSVNPIVPPFTLLVTAVTVASSAPLSQIDHNLFEQEELETDRYMFFSNLEQIHRQTGIMLEKDPKMIQSILDNGHDWAQDHIATAKESIDQTFDFFMNEEKGDSDEDFEDNKF